MVKIGTKNYLVKLWSYENYSPSNEPDSTIADARIFGFSSKINSGLSQMTFVVERSLQTWNAQVANKSNFDQNDIIEIWVNDIDTNDYIRIYAGYISQVNFVNTREKKTVTATCLGFVSRLSMDIYKDGTTSTISEATEDPSVMFQNIITKIKDSANGNIPFLSYQSLPTSSIETTNLSVDASFKSKSYLDAIEMCRELCPANWYWKLDENNVFHLKSKPIIPTHNFSLGSIERLDITYSMEGIRNGVLIWDNDTDYRYLQDDASVAKYGRRIERINAPQADDTEAMDKIALALIGERKDPRTIIRLTIADNNEFEAYGDLAGYDIESIKVGQTCNISGINELAGSFIAKNLFIVAVNYQPTKAIIDLDIPREDVSKFLVDLKKEQEGVEKDTIPTSYTVV